MTTKTDIQATYEKWLGSRADDPTLPHDLIRDAFLAGVEAERQTRGQPAVGEEIHVHIEGLDVLTLPLASSGIGAPRFVVHVPAQPDVSLTPDVQTDRQDRMPSDAEILACLRPLYSNDVAAEMGAEDDIRTARLLLSRYAAPVAAQAQRHEFDDCAASPTGKHSESWFANGDCEYCKAGAQPDAPLFYARAQPVVNQQMTTDTALADTQRQIIEAAEQRGYARAMAECAQDLEDAGDPLQGAVKWLLQALPGKLQYTHEIAARLMIGYNRAERLVDAARAKVSGHA